MSRLVGEIASLVEQRTRQEIGALPNDDAELRSVFNGPPMRYLRPLLEVLSADGGIECTLGNGERIVVPVLLPTDPPPAITPRIGASGECDKPYLIGLRNTPAGRRWIALAPPSVHDAVSVTGATDSFGIRGVNQTLTATVSDWMEDPFVTEIVNKALERNQWPGDAQRDVAKRLLASAAHDAEEAIGHDPSREGAWSALARVLSLTGTRGTFAIEWSLACGVPPMPDSSFHAKSQRDALELLAEAIESNGNGFAGCAARLKREATPEEDAWIDQMIAHLRQNAGTPLAFSSAPQAYYAPTLGDQIADPPVWWKGLTAPRIIELLDVGVPQPGAVTISCTNRLLGGQGLPIVVRSAPEIAVATPDHGGQLPIIGLQREAAGRGNRAEWAVSSGSQVVDDSVPQHASPIRYVASSTGYKNGSIRVTVLDAFEPALAVSARTASKLTLPRKVRGAAVTDYEAHLVLRGEGRHFLDVYVATGALLHLECYGEDSTTPGAERLVASVTPPIEGSDGAWGVEIVATTECQYDLRLTKANDESLTVRLYITAEEAEVTGCRSEFDRLLRLNTERARGPIEVQLDRQVRVADLQAWLLESAVNGDAPYPIVVAPDCDTCWHCPVWEPGASSIISNSRYIHDPRPSETDFNVPKELTAARAEIAKKIRGEDGHGLIEAAELGTWMADVEFAELVDSYVRNYARWLESEPTVAPWADVVAVVAIDGDGTLAQAPTALIMSPLHPLRFGWHALAQRTLMESWRSSSPCPAASILDPDCVPDAITLPLRAPTGNLQAITYLSTDSSSDYWAVLWNATQIGALVAKGALAPFGRDFGLQLGGVTGGFRVSQVKRALNDVALLRSAKPQLNILIHSSAAQGAASTEGVIEWSRERFGERAEADASEITPGERKLHIFDERDADSRPTSAEVANLLEDTRGATRWFAKKPPNVWPDLAIIAQLETTNASADPTTAGSPLSSGALLRHRIRSQLRAANGAFLTESRMGVAGPPSGEALADHVAQLSARLENLNEVRLGFTFAPRVGAIQTLFRDRNAEYVAVSSSAVDPACFLGGWLDGAYLWDYELPAYSNRPGDTSGYYLLSRIKPLDCDALTDVLSKLPDCDQLSTDIVEGILLEVSRRGIPTVRGLSAGHSGAAGDLGLFLAGRLLQDEFRLEKTGGSLLPVINSDGQAHEVVLVVPADPFQGYLFDLQRALKIPQFLRPDMIVIAFTITHSHVYCRITPVEVKYRQGTTLGAASKEALAQASALSALLSAIQKQGEDALLWRLAHQHLLLSIVDFGFRVYSQRPDVLRESQLWDRLHERVATAILARTVDLQFDPTGRLLAFDNSMESSPKDVDGDGFQETLVIAPFDAGKVARGDATALIEKLRTRLQDWRLYHTEARRVNSLARKEDPITPPMVYPGVPSEDRQVAEEDTIVQPDASVHPDEAIPITAPPEKRASNQQPVADESSATQARDVGTGSTGDQSTLSAHLEPAPDGVVVRVGHSAEGFHEEEKFFTPSNTDLNQLNIGVVGDLGTGKTQLLKSLICQLAASQASNGGVKPRFLIFDYKKDYISEDFVKAVGAKVVAPRNMPLNLFDTTGSSDHVPWMARFTFFADVLDKIYSNVGPVQRQNLKAAVRQAHDLAIGHGRAATIHDVHAQYEQIVKGRADAPLSIISDMIDMELFTRNPTDGESFNELFDGVVVISLAELGQDDRVKNMVVAIILNLFYQFMLKLPKRPYRGTDPQLRTVDSYLLVDEADNIMRYEFDVLRSLLLQGREFGVGVILASQYLRHFKVGATDYREPLLTWFIHKVPNIAPGELSALGLTGGTLQQQVERIKQLPKHHCLYKSHEDPGVIIRGLPFYQLITE